MVEHRIQSANSSYLIESHHDAMRSSYLVMPEVQTRFRFRSLHLAYLLIAFSMIVTSACSDASDDGGGTEGPSERPPVIFIPGITGSALVAKDGHILWPPEGPDANRIINILEVRKDFVRLSLMPTFADFYVEGIPGEKIYATDAIRYDGETQIYGPLIDYLVTKGKYREYRGSTDPAKRARERTYDGCDTSQKANKPSFFVFPYDWRLPIEYNSDLLADYIDCIAKLYIGRMEKFKVNIVTHSMGGLVARRYIIDHPSRVNKLITIAAPFLGSPKPLFQMIYGKISVEWSDIPSEALFGTYGLKGDPIREMLAYYPGLHQLMSTSAYFDLGGRPYRNLTLTFEDNELDFLPFMGPGGAVDKLFPSKSYNHETPAESNREFHSYTRNGNNQDDWSYDTTRVKYYHLVGVQKSNDTPLTVQDMTRFTGIIRPLIAYGVNIALDLNFSEQTVRLLRDIDAYSKASTTISQTVLRDYIFTKFGPGDGTVPLLSGTRIGNGQNLNAPNAKLFIYSGLSAARLEIASSPKISLYNVSDEEHNPLDHAGIVTNHDVQAKVLELLQEDDDVVEALVTPVSTATQVPATRAPTPTATIAPTATSLATATRTPTRTPASPTAVAFKYILKEVLPNRTKAPLLYPVTPFPSAPGDFTRWTVNADVMTTYIHRVYNEQVTQDYTFTFNLSKPPAELLVGKLEAFTVTGKGVGIIKNGSAGALFDFAFKQPGETARVSLGVDANGGTTSGSATVHYVLSPQAVGPTITLGAFLWNCAACSIQWVYERVNLNGPP